MCRRKQRPPSRKRPSSWGRRLRRSPGGWISVDPGFGAEVARDPHRDHLRRIISLSPTHNMVLHTMFYIPESIPYDILYPIFYPKLHPNYIPILCFSHHIFRHTRMLFVTLLFIPDDICTVIRHLGVQSSQIPIFG